MKIKCLIAAMFIALLCTGCLEKKEETQEQRHSEIQEKFNKHAECVKSQNVDILKDSVRFKAVFDSCWQQQQTTINANLKKAEDPKIPLDSSQIVTLKDFDPEDSIMVGVRAFRAAKKEFVKRWNYTKDTHLVMDIVDQICRDVRPCAAMIDSVAYKNDVTFILDSLMRNNLLDSLIEAKEQEINESEKIAPWGHDDRLKNLEMSKKINEFIRDNE